MRKYYIDRIERTIRRIKKVEWLELVYRFARKLAG